MGCIGKTFIRLGLIGAIGLGAAVAIAGKDRVQAAAHEVRSSVRGAIDAKIGDPAAMRAQLRQLEAEYPAKIAEVESDLAELREQVSLLAGQAERFRTVVSLAEQDYAALSGAIARVDAEGAAIRTTTFDTRPVMISFRGRVLDVASAEAEADFALKTRDAYRLMTDDIDRQLERLVAQEQNLAALAGKLKAEQAEFQSQLFQLEREVDAIARNSRMIELMEKRQARIDSYDRYEAHSLDQIRARLGEKRRAQDARLDALAVGVKRESYEDRARIEIGRHGSAREHRDAPRALTAPAIGPVRVIEADPQDALDAAEDRDDEDAHAPVAARGF